MNDPTPHSTRFRRAAVAECERLLRRQSRASGRVSKLEEDLSQARRELAEIVDRIEKLHSLTGEQASPKPVAVAPLSSGTPISGAEIRRVAVGVLRDSGVAKQPIHYRGWLALVEDAGYAVGGKRPEAVFLGQLARSPVVKATTQSGYYELDAEAPERLRRQISSLEQASSELSAVEPKGPAEIESQIAKQRELSMELRRLQKALHEALVVLGDSEKPADRVAA
jgi:hypothetical protein